jgi:hypothetical protein
VRAVEPVVKLMFVNDPVGHERAVWAVVWVFCGVFRFEVPLFFCGEQGVRRGGLLFCVCSVSFVCFLCLVSWCLTVVGSGSAVVLVDVWLVGPGLAVVSSVLRFDCWLSVRQEVKGTVFSACFVVCVCPWFVGEVCVVERVSMWLGGMQR